MANDVNVKITADDSGLNAGLNRAKRNLTAWTGEVQAASQRFQSAFGLMSRAVGVFGIALGAREIINGLKNIADHIDSVGKQAARLNMTTEALSELQYAARMNGSSSEAMSAALQRLSTNIGLAASGTETAKQAFDAMGISLSDATGKLKTADQVFREVSEKFAGYSDGANKSALATAIFGKSGAELINTLNLGKAGLASAAAEARKFGQVVDSDAAKAAARFNDDLDRLKSLATQAGQSILSSLIPSLTRLAERFVAALNASKGFWGFLSTFTTLSSEDFEAPGKAVEKYEAQIADAQKTLNELRSEQSGVEKFSEEWEELETQALETEKSINDMRQAIVALNSTMPAQTAQTQTTTGKKEAPVLASSSSGKSSTKDSSSAKEIAEQLRVSRQKAEIAELYTQRELDLLETKIQRERENNERAVSLGLMTKEELLVQEQKFQNSLYEQQRQAITQRLNLLKNDPTQNVDAKIKLNKQLLELDKKHAKEVLKLEKDTQKERDKYQQQFYDSMKTGFASTLTQFMQGSLTIKGLFQGLWQDILNAFIGCIAQMLSEWIANQIMMMIFGKETGASNIATAAAKAGAEGTASFAGAPWPINMGAPAFGATMFANAMAYEGALAVAAGGFDIPAGLNPVTQLHEKEMVLPANIADPLRESLASKKQGTTVVNLKGVSAGKFFVATRKDLIKVLNGGYRDFAFRG